MLKLCTLVIIVIIQLFTCCVPVGLLSHSLLGVCRYNVVTLGFHASQMTVYGQLMCEFNLIFTVMQHILIRCQFQLSCSCVGACKYNVMILEFYAFKISAYVQFMCELTMMLWFNWEMLVAGNRMQKCLGTECRVCGGLYLVVFVHMHDHMYVLVLLGLIPTCKFVYSYNFIQGGA